MPVPLSDRVVLENTHVRLEPLSIDHVDELATALAEGGLEHTWYTSVPTPETVADDVANRLALHAAGLMNPWAVRRASDGALVGCTTYCNIAQADRHVEVGHTWLVPSAQRTGVNSAAKLLLFGHAFEACDAIAVELRTHWHNRQSRAAIERLGAKLDGVLRNHKIGPDGVLRDTVVYSVLPHEWPAVRATLQASLTRHTR
ncbi:GNAT family N-acetyltransferase [Quadrisphaera granulorum]|uniref:GNAT family N-acetyltransferase n=1 Tax=Quadrisphaera granulorum TaxID=317664 RepID=UPI001FE70272|nr:GNAT family protein [Quadrisphaera granulorum]